MATNNFNIPELSQGQAQKEITHNEALRYIDALVNNVVLDNTLTTPPVSPVEGGIYIPAATATDAWVGQEDKLALYINSEWKFVTPSTDYIIYSTADNSLIKWDGAAWSQLVLTATTTHWHTYNSAQTLVSDDAVVTDTSTAGFNLTLPITPSVGNRVKIFDGTGNWSTNNIVVLRNGSNIMGLAQDLTLNIDSTNVTLYYISASEGWVIEQ